MSDNLRTCALPRLVMAPHSPGRSSVSRPYSASQSFRPEGGPSHRTQGLGLINGRSQESPHPGQLSLIAGPAERQHVGPPNAGPQEADCPAR